MRRWFLVALLVSLVVPYGLLVAAHEVMVPAQEALLQDEPVPEPGVELPAALVTILSVFLPWIVEQVNRRVEKRDHRFMIALAASGLTGVGSTLLAGISAGNLILFLGTAFTLSQVAHHMFWRKLWQDEPDQVG